MRRNITLHLIFVFYFIGQTYAEVNCSKAGVGRHLDTSDQSRRTYTLCVAKGSTYSSYTYKCPAPSLFNPTTQKCTANYSYNSLITANCTSEGYFPDPNSFNCTSYIECVLIDGFYVETSFTCPEPAYFNPDTTMCEYDYVCKSSGFVCSSAGRFPDPSDYSCKTYFFCVLRNGTYVQQKHTCPSSAVFNPTSKICSTSYTCTAVCTKLEELLRLLKQILAGT